MADEVDVGAKTFWNLLSDARVCALEDMGFPRVEVLFCHFFPLLEVFFLSFYDSLLPGIVVSYLVKIIKPRVTMLAIED